MSSSARGHQCDPRPVSGRARIRPPVAEGMLCDARPPRGARCVWFRRWRSCDGDVSRDLRVRIRCASRPRSTRRSSFCERRGAFASSPHPALAWRANCDFLVVFRSIQLRTASTVSGSTMDRFQSATCPVRMPERDDHRFRGTVATPVRRAPEWHSTIPSGGLHSYPPLPSALPASLAPTVHRTRRSYPLSHANAFPSGENR